MREVLCQKHILNDIVVIDMCANILFLLCCSKEFSPMRRKHTAKKVKYVISSQIESLILFLFFTDQAFVTLATNDNYARGAMVLGKSLLNHNTSKKLVALIGPQVSEPCQ